MRTPLSSSRALLAAIAALGGFLGSSFAQSVTTAPVGAVTTSIGASSDKRLGVTLLRPSLYAGVVSGTPTTTLTSASAIPSLGSEVKFVRFTSGAAEGQWIQVVSSTSSTITLTESASALGAAAGDKFEVRPFWTLASFLPSGGGVPASPDVFAPRAFVLLNSSASTGINLAASALYFYHDGSQGPAGWYSGDGNLTPSDSVILSPETSITIRNSTGQAASVVGVGDVPVTKVANTVISRVAGAQDNLVYNPYPAAITLSTSNLVSSGAVSPSPDVFAPVDIVFVYNATGINAAPSASYFYHDGTQGPAGWYSNDGNLTPADSLSIPDGAAITIRKRGGTATVAEWVPALPYTL
jgi:uncharacterized protein (TIGR02597 family)